MQLGEWIRRNLHWRQRGPRLRRVRVAPMLQMEAVECGAVSLAMILAYYRKHVPIETLRNACGVSRDGSKASNLVKAARLYGLAARGFQVEADGLPHLPLPFIAFWNFNHFLVVTGFGRNKVYLNDPASGRRVIGRDEFDQAFTGVVLGFEKGPGFEAGGTAPSLGRALLKRLAGTRVALLYLLLVGLCLVVPGLLIPVFSRIFIDAVLVSAMESWVGPLIVGMLLNGLLLAVLTGLQRVFLVRLEVRIALSTSARFFWHVLRLPVGFYQQRSAGDIAARVGLNNRVATVLSEDVLNGVLGGLTALLFAGVMLFYDLWMSLVSISVIGLNFLAMWAAAAWRRENTQKAAIDKGRVQGISQSGLMLMETLKASGAESAFFARWAGNQARLSRSMQAMLYTAYHLDLIPRLLTTTNSVLILAMGGMRVMNGEMTMGMLVAFQTLVSSFVHPLNTLVALASKVQNFQGDMGRLDDVLEHPCQVAGQAAAVSLAGEPSGLVAGDESVKLDGALELRNVTFGYAPLAPPLLSDFSMRLLPGQRVALVGASGCGKSTIAKLVMGLYQPWQGELLFDGVPGEQIARSRFLNSVASVDQEISLFSGTIRDNLTMWDSTVPDAVMIAAARDACIHEVISQRPGGYDGEVLEGGSNFSGGQRQRLEIARALTGNPRLLVMDEATSALDPMTEKALETNLRRRGCSCLIVAHRLSAIRDCDEIIVLEQGRVIERGSHAALMRLNGHYARLIGDE